MSTKTRETRTRPPETSTKTPETSTKTPETSTRTPETSTRTPESSVWAGRPARPTERRRFQPGPDAGTFSRDRTTKTPVRS
jgi:hypothetical protein